MKVVEVLKLADAIEWFGPVIWAFDSSLTQVLIISKSTKQTILTFPADTEVSWFANGQVHFDVADPDGELQWCTIDCYTVVDAKLKSMSVEQQLLEDQL